MNLTFIILNNNINLTPTNLYTLDLCDLFNVESIEFGDLSFVEQELMKFSWNGNVGAFNNVQYKHKHTDAWVDYIRDRPNWFDSIIYRINPLFIDIVDVNNINSIQFGELCLRDQNEFKRIAKLIEYNVSFYSLDCECWINIPTNITPIWSNYTSYRVTKQPEQVYLELFKCQMND